MRYAQSKVLFVVQSAEQMHFDLFFENAQFFAKKLQRLGCYTEVREKEKKQNKKQFDKEYRTKGGNHMLLCGIAAVCLTAITVVTFTVL